MSATALSASSVCVMLIATSASGAVNLTAQSRSVNVGGYDIATNQFVAGSQSAPDFSPFNASFPALQGDIVSGTAWAPTFQTSSLNLPVLSANGSAQGNYYFRGGGSYPSFAGQTSFSVTFTVDTPTPFTIVASGPRFERYFGDVVADGFVRLIDNASNAILHSSEPVRPPVASPIFIDFANVNALPLNVAGVLQPGSYTLSAFAFGTTYRFTSGQPSTYASSFNVNMVIPTPATGAMIALAAGFAARRRRA
jgi:hypothetical protein